MQNSLQNPAQAEKMRVKVDMPKYSSYYDSIRAIDYLYRLQHYQLATRVTAAEILVLIVVVFLTDQAARWF